jgi:hypothetical protein
MYNVATNPIPKSNLFVTPNSLEEVIKFIQAMPAKEQAQAMTAVQFALNWAHDAVEKEILSKEIFA